MIAYIIILVYIALYYIVYLNNKLDKISKYNLFNYLWISAWPWWLMFIGAVESSNKKKIFSTAIIVVSHLMAQIAILVLYRDCVTFPFGEVIAYPAALALILSIIYFLWNKYNKN